MIIPNIFSKSQVRWGDVPSHWFLSSESSTVQPPCTANTIQWVDNSHCTDTLIEDCCTMQQQLHRISALIHWGYLSHKLRRLARARFEGVCLWLRGNWSLPTVHKGNTPPRGVALLAGGFGCASFAQGLRTQTHPPGGIQSPPGRWVSLRKILHWIFNGNHPFWSIYCLLPPIIPIMINVVKNIHFHTRL